MTTSNTITKNDLAAILGEVIPVQGIDMSAAGIEAFVDALDIRSGESLTSKIFIAIVNETSYQDVVNALEAKKVVYAYTTNSQGTYNVYPYAHHNANLIVFTRTHYNQSSQQVKFVTLDSTDTWTTTTVSTADYVIEQGTSGIWTYRKWNSGIAECWGLWSGTLSHYGSALGGYAYNTGAISYPSGLFVAKPNAQFSGQIGSGFCLCGTILGNSSKDNIVCYAIATSSGSQSCNFYIYSVGAWK